MDKKREVWRLDIFSEYIFFLICVFLIVVYYTKMPFYTFLFPFVCIVLLSILNYCVCFKGSESEITFIAIWVIKFITLCYHSVHKSVPMGGVDGLGFNNRALTLLSSNDSCIGILFSPDQSLLPKIVAIIYSIGGLSVEVIYFYMFTTSLITQLYIYKIFILLTGKVDVSRKICLLWMIWPIEFIFSITFLREMPIQCLFTVSFYQFLLFLRYNR
jgi:hypothetical protein